MKKFTVLLVENQVDNITSLEQILEENDFEVQSAPNEQKAFRILKDQIIDLVFIDINLPQLQSFEICKAIKSNPNWGIIPVIFIAGHDDLSLINKIFESGADDLVFKPLIYSDIIRKSGTLIEFKYSRQMAKNINQMLESKVVQRTNELEDSLKKLSQANKELEILEVAKSEFFNLISHEIRTPLNGILGSLALIERYKLPDEVSRYFTLLDFSVRRLENFSNTILEASILRIKGEKALVIQESDLIDIMEIAMNQCLAQFSEKNIVIEFRKESKNTILRGDSKYLLKCFTAILENAFKFSNNGDTVEITMRNEPDRYLKVTIADSGCGFSKVSLDNLFHAMSNLEGHIDKNIGMGLHLAKLIIEAHRGSITVGNRNPKGAFVEILVPIGK